MRREATIAAGAVGVFAVLGAAAFYAVLRYTPPPRVETAAAPTVRLDDTRSTANGESPGTIASGRDVGSAAPALEGPLAAEPPAAESAAAKVGHEAGMVEARDALREAYAARSAETGAIAPVEEELGVIEGAVVSILEAISADPGNPGLRDMLVMTYRNEVRLLKKALRLSGEDAEEAFAETEAGAGQG